MAFSVDFSGILPAGRVGFQKRALVSWAAGVGKGLAVLGAGLLILVMPTLLRESASGIYLDWAGAYQELSRFVQDALSGRLFVYRLGETERGLGELFPPAFGYSLVYLVLPSLLGLVLGIALGLQTGRKAGNGFLNFFAVLGMIPDFILALFLMAGAVAFYQATGIRIARISYVGYSLRVPLLAIPLITMTLISGVFTARSTAVKTREILGSNYILFARAKGLSRRVLLYRHLLAGVLAEARGDLPRLLAVAMGNLFIMERYFNLPGLSRLLFNFGFSVYRISGTADFVYRAQFGLCLMALLGLGAAYLLARGFLEAVLLLAQRRLS